MQLTVIDGHRRPTRNLNHSRLASLYFRTPRRASILSSVFYTVVVSALILYVGFLDGALSETFHVGPTRTAETDSERSINIEDATSSTSRAGGALKRGADNGQPRAEALVAPMDITLLSIIGMDDSEAQMVDFGLCTLASATRQHQLPQSKEHQDITERSLNCSGISESNHQLMAKNMRKHSSRSSIQQIEITDSESWVFPAVGIICDHFNCSMLTVFNMSGQPILDTNALNSWLQRWLRLEVLDLTNTSLTSIESIMNPSNNQSNHQPLVLHNLTTLILDYNNLGQLNFDTILEHMPNLQRLSAINNSIFDINCTEKLRHKFDSQLELISLANNSINCEKSQMWLMDQFQDPNKSHKYPDHEQILCASPKRLADMTWSQRISVLKTPICDDCDCKSLKRTAISVDCHNKNLQFLPDVLPVNTKILNLTSNRISSISVPRNSTNWENVTYVYLENNLITSFQPLERNSKFLRNLAALDVRRNKFQEFPSHIFEQFINLDQVHLSNNPWLCECEATFAFQEWLQRQFQKVGDKEEIMCGISGPDENGVRSYNIQQRLSARVIYRLSKSELCPQDNLEEPYDWLDMVNLLLSLVIFLILTKVSLDYIYQHRTKRLPHFFKLNF